MGEGDAIHPRTGKTGDFVRPFQSASSPGGGHQGLGDDVDLSILLQGDVFEIRVEGHGQRRGQGPGRGGPDDGGNLLSAQPGSIASGALVSR